MYTKFPDIFRESKSTNTNLERLTDKLNVKHYVQVFIGSRPRTSPFSVRRIKMFGMTEEYPFAPQHNTFKEKQLFFSELKNQWCLAGKHCFGRGPKAQVIAMD